MSWWMRRPFCIDQHACIIERLISMQNEMNLSGCACVTG